MGFLAIDMSIFSTVPKSTRRSPLSTQSKQQVYIAPSKSGKPRYVPLNASGVELFTSLTTGREAKDPMFVRSDGESWGKNHQQRPLLEACKRAKITPPLRFHEARHSYASALAQAGADLLTISKLLGHAETRITSRQYAHLTERDAGQRRERAPAVVWRRGADQRRLDPITDG